ncbi:hypothetical protein KGQ27_00990 [Patescibacteria group bacterium]|nr:hypothetical protein [Patescibacteria group bacterium]MDE1946579.1 hypothetical protein [Patescibacteria group bacterium]MDE2010860.1 hypothetical protein [Patescibacteria group bacterium]MDE2233206.1 hypothetical protein [Patescibacteria group bacterium]
MLFSHKDNEKLALLVNLQSSIIKLSFVVIKPAVAPHIVYTLSKDIHARHYAESIKFIEASLGALRGAIETGMRRFKDIAKSDGLEVGIPPIDEVHFVLSSPWVVSRAKIISLSFVKPTAITRDLVLNAIKNEREKDFPPDAKISIIEEKIFDVLLNGYSNTNWERKQTLRADVSFATTVAGIGMTDRLRGVCEEHGISRSVAFHSAPLLFFTGMRIVEPEARDCLLLHVHGELTDIVAVERGNCALFASYPLGADSLAHAVAKTAKVSDDTADSTVSLYIGGYLDEKESAASIHALKQAGKDWADGVKNTLTRANLSLGDFQSIVVSADKHEDFFETGLAGLLEKNRVHTVHSLQPEDLTPFVSSGQHAELAKMMGLYAVAVNNLEYARR